MKIDHIAIWTSNLEGLKQFYVEFFEGEAGAKYHNPKTGLETYFLTFSTGSRLEIMQKPLLQSKKDDFNSNQQIGLTHLAFSVGGKTGVNNLTERLRGIGHVIVSEPRTTGDGYYESVVLDPDGNRIEIIE